MLLSVFLATLPNSTSPILFIIQIKCLHTDSFPTLLIMCYKKQITSEDNRIPKWKLIDPSLAYHALEHSKMGCTFHIRHYNLTDLKGIIRNHSWGQTEEQYSVCLGLCLHRHSSALLTILDILSLWHEKQIGQSMRSEFLKRLSSEEDGR